MLSDAETSSGKLVLLSDSLSFRLETREVNNRPADVKRSGFTTGSRTLGIHSKRNRTIGLGEHEQLEFMVNESIIRWSSCTHLTTSLRSSLVC